MTDQNAIRAAQARIKPYIRQTPVIELPPGTFGLDATLILKLENLQVSGSFKIRGAANTIRSHPKAAAKGLIAASGGNHGVAVATLARDMGLPVKIFVPTVSSEAKRTLLRTLGAELFVEGKSYVEARDVAQKHALSHDRLIVHPFESKETITGQGTLGAEIDEQTTPDAVVVSVGGGGLAAGLAAWFQTKIPLICVEPERAPTLNAALQAKQLVDVAVGGIAADALGSRRLGDVAFDILSSTRALSCLVTEDEIKQAQLDLWNTLRLAVEPAAAVTLAGLRKQPKEQISGKRIAVLICGGNVDPAQVTTAA